MRIETRPVRDLNPAAYNPRVALCPGDPEYERLSRSLDEFGLVEPLVWNQRTGHLVGGHQRLRVLIDKGHTHAQVSVVDLPLEKEKALNLALNKIAGRWDEQKLAELLAELTETPELDVTLSGFDLEEIDAVLARAAARAHAEEDFDCSAALDAAAALPPVTKPGDLIVLGRDQRLSHRVVCGDSTDAATVKRLMAGQRAALCCTDPPYLVGYDGTNRPAPARERGKKPPVRRDDQWDDPSSAANADLHLRYVATALAVAVREDAAWYCWHASRTAHLVESAWAQHGLLAHQQVIWVKPGPVPGRSWYGWRHEPCLMGWKQGHRPPRCDKSVLSTVWEVGGSFQGEERPDHPTPKPTALFEIPISQHTQPGEIVYEPFAGSGSQLIAAERTARRCYAVETNPRYVDLIVRRYIALCGEASVEPAVAEKYRLREPVTAGIGGAA